MAKEAVESIFALPDLKGLTPEEQTAALAVALDRLRVWAEPHFPARNRDLDSQPAVPGDLPAGPVSGLDAAVSAALALLHNQVREEIEALRSEMRNGEKGGSPATEAKAAGNDALDQLQNLLEASVSRIDQSLEDSLRALTSQAQENLVLLKEKFHELAGRLEAAGGDHLNQMEQKRQAAINDLEGLADQLAGDLRAKGEEVRGELDGHLHQLLHELQNLKDQNLQALEEKRFTGEEALHGIIETGVSRLSSFVSEPDAARIRRETPPDFLPEHDDE